MHYRRTREKLKKKSLKRCEKNLVHDDSVKAKSKNVNAWRHQREEKRNFEYFLLRNMLFCRQTGAKIYG